MNLWLMLFLGVSLLFNVFFIAVAFMQPYRMLFKHMWHKAYSDTSDKVSGLFLNKNGVVTMELLDVESGHVKRNDGRYVLNHNAQFSWHGVPLQIWLEGQSRPVNPYGEGESLSTKELNTIMRAGQVDEFIQDLLDRLKQYYPMAITVCVVFAGFVLLSIYFGWNIWDYLINQGATVIPPNNVTGG